MCSSVQYLQPNIRAGVNFHRLIIALIPSKEFVERLRTAQFAEKNGFLISNQFYLVVFA